MNLALALETRRSTMTGSCKWIRAGGLIEFSVNERIARIALNRPDKRNALNHALVEQLHQALLEADDRTDVNVVIIEGRGRDFCSGYDLTGAYAGDADAENPDPMRYRTRGETLDDDCWQLERTQEALMFTFDAHKPVIAKIHGNCLAGGTDLALGCDIVIAADDARIGFPATRANGNPPNHWWVYHCGP